MALLLELRDFLQEKGICPRVNQVAGYGYLEVILKDDDLIRCILPLEIKARTPEEAILESEKASQAVAGFGGMYAGLAKVMVVPQDRWIRQREMMEARILAHLNMFSQVYARNCVIRRIDQITAASFLAWNHSYGDASCRYRYGMFLKRHTGHNALEGQDLPAPETLVAVATFSNARKWVKGDDIIRSYEWVRYASLPGVRVVGGMGRILNAFTVDLMPDDIMSYADLEWSEGEVYERLGFELEGRKSPVMFMVDDQWRRHPVNEGMPVDADVLYFRNFGSNKYRLKLTPYE